MPMASSAVAALSVVAASNASSFCDVSEACSVGALAQLQSIMAIVIINKNAVILVFICTSPFLVNIYFESVYCSMII